MAGKKTNVKATGRKKGKILAYYQLRWAPRKIRHMLKRNGVEFATAWARARGQMDILQKMLKKVA